MCRARNEGIYLLPWLSYHLALGIDHVLIVTNDLSDGSDQLLKHIAEIEPRFTWLDSSREPLRGRTVGVRSYDFAWRNFDFQSYSWMLVLDIDEFLCLPPGVGLQEWLGRFHKTDQVVLFWRNFGANGHIKRPHGDWILESYLESQPLAKIKPREFKSMHRTKTLAGVGTHFSPMEKNKIVRVSNASGQLLYSGLSQQARDAVYGGELTPSWEGAWVNHYSTLSVEEYVMRGYRGAASDREGAANEKYGPNYFLHRNRHQEVSAQPPDCAMAFELYRNFSDYPEVKDAVEVVESTWKDSVNRPEVQQRISSLSALYLGDPHSFSRELLSYGEGRGSDDQWLSELKNSAGTVLGK